MPIDLSNIYDYNPRQLIVRNETNLPISIGDLKVILNAKPLPGSTIDLIKLQSFNKRPFRTFDQVANSRDLELLVTLGKVSLETENGILTIDQGIRETEIGSLLDEGIAGSITHSELVGLLNDDHTQYYNQTRGDARYLRRSQNFLDLVDVSAARENLGRGDPFGLASLDNTGKVPLSELPNFVSGLNFRGLWNASTNTPALASGVGVDGDFYIVSVSGSTNLDGNSTWAIKDYAIFVTSAWFRIVSTDLVSSVFGRTGVVSAVSGDYTATLITNVPSGNITSTNVQSALNELDGFIDLKPDTFLELDDTPSSYSGFSNNLLKVNSAANALNFASYLYGDDINGRLGIGQSTPASPLHIGEAAGGSGLLEPGGPILPVPKGLITVTSNVSSGSDYGISAVNIHKMTVDNSSGVGIAGLDCAVLTIGAGESISSLYGRLSKIETVGAGDISVANANYSIIFHLGGGTLTEASCYFAEIGTNISSAITTAYGLRVASLGGSSVATKWGLYISVGNNYFSGRTKIGSAAIPNDSAAIDMSDCSLGFLAPVHTDFSMGGVSSPAEGLLIYNISQEKFKFYRTSGSPSGWKDIGYGTSHNQLNDLTSGDDHSQYLYLNGRTGGQMAIGGTDANDDLLLKSTSNATIGKVKVSGRFEVDALLNDSRSLALLSTAALPSAISVQGNYAFLTGIGFFYIYDITNKTDPDLISSIALPGGIDGISLKAVGRYLYIVGGSTGFLIYDVSNPAVPSLVKNLSIGGTPWDIQISGKFAYVTGIFGDDIKSIDISDPPNAVIADSLPLPTLTTAAGLACCIQDKYAYVTSIDDDRFHIVDISDPYNMSIVSTLDLFDGGDPYRPNDVEVVGRYAFIAGETVTEAFFKVIDISDVTSPTVVHTSVGTGVVWRITISGKYMFFFNGFSNLLLVYDISDPKTPIYVNTIICDDSIRDVEIDGKYLIIGEANGAIGQIEIIEWNGAEVSNILAHSLTAGKSRFMRDVKINNKLDVGTSITVGAGGILSDGNVCSSTYDGSNFFGAPIINKTTTEAKIKEILGTRSDIFHINYDSVDGKVYLYRYNTGDATYYKIELGTGPGTAF